jgi:flagellin
MARINTSVTSLIAQRNLNTAYGRLNSTLEHLSTGLRINRGKDDPAGLIVSERLRSEIGAANQAVSNTQRAKLIVSTTEGALDEVAALLKDIQAKIIGAANEGAMSEDEIKANQLQIDSAIDSITRIANTTAFAGRMLLDGSLQYATSGVTDAAIGTYQIHATQFGTLDSVAVKVAVTSAATQARLSFPFTALASAVTLEVRGRNGVTTVNFDAGTSASDMVEAVVAVRDATGVSAVMSTGGWYMLSTDYGTRSFVSVKPLGGQHSQISETKIEGTNANAAVNGTHADADGNHLAIKTASVDLEMDLVAGWASNTTFSITGGGALFQVGPHVNTNLQVNMAVPSVAASNLGNTEMGFLAQVKTGGDYNLKDKKFTEASRIVDESIRQISVLRGRLGSFERNTLETNMNQLGITVENLMSAESSIRDADFAYETSQLARNQILVNAGTTVLTLANQSTQSVLRLLGG